MNQESVIFIFNLRYNLNRAKQKEAKKTAKLLSAIERQCANLKPQPSPEKLNRCYQLIPIVV